MEETDVREVVGRNDRSWKPSRARSATGVTTALILAAGAGSRLRPLTLNAPKCLTDVSGTTILGRLVCNLRREGIQRLVVVTGYLDRCVREFLDSHASDFQVDYVVNPIYRTTNNIYSLWLARHAIQEPFVLIESDLVFEESMLQGMLIPNKIAVSRIRPWMNGTTVELDAVDGVTAFHLDKHFLNPRRYKTVNIYSLGLLSWRATVDRLSQYISDQRVEVYYESVFADMVADKTLSFDAVFFDENRWYEIDTLSDLTQAELLFPHSSSRLLSGGRGQPMTVPRHDRPAARATASRAGA